MPGAAAPVDGGYDDDGDNDDDGVGDGDGDGNGDGDGDEDDYDFDCDYGSGEITRVVALTGTSLVVALVCANANFLRCWPLYTSDAADDLTRFNTVSELIRTKT